MNLEDIVGRVSELLQQGVMERVGEITPDELLKEWGTFFLGGHLMDSLVDHGDYALPEVDSDMSTEMLMAAFGHAEVSRLIEDRQKLLAGIIGFNRQLFQFFSWWLPIVYENKDYVVEEWFGEYLDAGHSAGLVTVFGEEGVQFYPKTAMAWKDMQAWSALFGRDEQWMSFFAEEIVPLNVLRDELQLEHATLKSRISRLFKLSDWNQDVCQDKRMGMRKGDFQRQFTRTQMRYRGCPGEEISHRWLHMLVELFEPCEYERMLRVRGGEG